MGDRHQLHAEIVAQLRVGHLAGTGDVATVWQIIELVKDAGWIAKSDLVEQACAGAVVGYLPLLQTCRSDIQCDECDLIGDSRMCDPPPIPIASVGPFVELAGDVARGLLDPTAWQTGDPTCDDCDESPPCRMSDDEIAAQRAQDGTGICDDFAWRRPIFTAAYADITVKGERWREYVLVSAPCETCGGTGKVESRALRAALYAGPTKVDCDACGATGASVDMKDVAGRYSNGPETADNTAREARFRVRA